MKHRRGSWEAETEAIRNATRELPLFAHEYYEQGRKSARKGTTPEKLHQFRLASKHFRYLLELFRPLFGPRMDVLLKRLRRVQTLLGELNDYATAKHLAIGSGTKPSLESQRLSAHLSEQNRKKLAEFRRYWKDEFDAEGEEERWKGYLGRAPRTSAPRKRTSK